MQLVQVDEVGAEPLQPIGDGRARGVEIFVQRKLTDAVWLLGAYTLSSSEFAGSDGVLAPSSWDVRHAADLTAEAERLIDLKMHQFLGEETAVPPDFVS